MDCILAYNLNRLDINNLYIEVVLYNKDLLIKMMDSH